MLYLGHFSFSQTLPKRRTRGMEPWNGYFTTVADAPDADAAIAKFRSLVRGLRDAAMFKGVHEVYLDVCIEIRTLPPGGLLSYFSSREGDNLGGVSTSIPGAKASEARAYDIQPDAGEEEQTVEPFVVLHGRPRPVRGRSAIRR